MPNINHISGQQHIGKRASCGQLHPYPSCLNRSVKCLFLASKMVLRSHVGIISGRLCFRQIMPHVTATLSSLLRKLEAMLIPFILEGD